MNLRSRNPRRNARQTQGYSPETAGGGPQTVPPHSVLLLGNYRPALEIARRLSALGHKVIVGSGGGEGATEYSRHVQEMWTHRDVKQNPAQLCQDLIGFLGDREDIRTVIPVTEEFAVLLARCEHQIPETAALASPSAEIIELFNDKMQALQLAGSLAVPCHANALVRNHADLIAAAGRIGYPLTIRPFGTTARIAGRKALIIRSCEHLICALPSWPAGHDELLLQLYASGQRHNVYFAAQDGELAGVVESRINRTDRADGTGLAVDGQTVPPSPELVEDTQALVRATGYHGIGLAQFIVDAASGTRCFLELNPRISGSHAVPENAGLPLTAFAVNLAHGRAGFAGLPAWQGYDATMRYVWTYGDIRGLKTAAAERSADVKTCGRWALNLVAAALKADFHMTWRWSDPLPALVLAFRQLPLLGRLLHRPHFDPARRVMDTHCTPKAAERARESS